MRNLFIALLLLSACSGKDSVKSTDLMGRVENNTFINEYLTIDARDWTIKTDSLDETTFLRLEKNAAGITFMFQEKTFYDKAGITSKRNLKQALIKVYQKDPIHKVVYDKTMKIDGAEFLTFKTRFTTAKGSGHTIFYVGEMRNHYLIVIFVEDDRWPAPDAETLISGMKFN